MPARSHDSRPVLSLLRPCKRGGQSGADDMEKTGSRRKDSAFAAAKDIGQKVAAGDWFINALLGNKMLLWRVGGHEDTSP